MNQRGSKRTKRRVQCRFTAGGAERSGVITDLSAGSAFIEADGVDLPELGAETEIAVQVGAIQPLLRGRVVRRQETGRIEGTPFGIGFAVRFVDTGPAETDVLGLLIQKRKSGDIWDVERWERVNRSSPLSTGETEALSQKPGSETATASVLLLDRGELEELHELLVAMRVDCTRMAVGPGMGLETLRALPRVLITTAPIAASLPIPVSHTSAGVVTMAIAESESNTLRGLLRKNGYRYVVPRSVHPETLRILIAECLHGGPARREVPRRALGCPVECRLGPERFTGWVLEIAANGCRLESPVDVAPGARLELRFPPLWAGASRIRLNGCVIRAGKGGLGTGVDASLGILFDPPRAAVAARLAQLVERVESGPVAPPRDVPVPSLAATLKRAAERRYGARFPHRGEILVLEGSVAAQVLVGRDVSKAGLGAEFHPLLALGDRLQLALPDADRGMPLVIPAEIIRHDEALGVGLRFVEPEQDLHEQLEQWIAALVRAEEGSDPPGGA